MPLAFPDNPIPETEEDQIKSTAVTITPSTVNVPLIMVLTTIVAVLISMFYSTNSWSLTRGKRR